MSTYTAFFYGTLMAPQVLSRVTGHPVTTLTIRPAILPNHRRHRVREADYPALLPQSNSAVRGTLVSGLTDADVRRLDLFEGREYVRRKVKARLIPAEKGQTEEEAGSAEAVLGVDTSVEALEHASKPDEEHGVATEDLGGEVACETYVWSAPRDDLEDAEWDFDEFVREKLWRWAGSDNEYREVDDAVQAEQQQQQQQQGGGDPTGGRNFRDGTFEQALDAGNGVQEKEVLESAV